MDKLDQMADAVVGAMRGFVTRSLDGIVKRLEAVEARQPEKGEAGKDGANGKDADAASIAAEVLKSIPIPKDGEKGEAGKDGDSGADGRDGRDGGDGLPGRDALQIDILPGIDFERAYQRGTFAELGGGIVRAFRNTDPVKDGDYVQAGWAHVVRGLAAIDVQQHGERGFVIALKHSDGAMQEHKFSVPTVIDRGVWREGPYEKGDGVTWGGSFFIAQKDNPQGKPGESDDWRLAVKRGRDGKDGGGPPVPSGPVKLR